MAKPPHFCPLEDKVLGLGLTRNGGLREDRAMKAFSPLDDEFLRLIGLMTCYYTMTEFQMELAILRHLGIDPSIGLVLMGSMSGQAKLDLLVMFNNEGAFKPKSTKEEVQNLLEDIRRAHRKRNQVAHHAWLPTADPKVARRMGVRTKGKLEVVDEAVHITSLERNADFIHQVGVCFLEFVQRQGLGPKDDGSA